MRPFLAFVVLCLVAFVSNVHAAVPGTIAYQGVITSGGVPLSGTHTLDVAIYDVASGGSALWSESHASVLFASGGVYAIQLGSVTAFPSSLFAANGQLYLELTVDGSTMTTRSPFNAVPYALVAESAAHADTANYAITSGTSSTSGDSLWTQTGNDIHNLNSGNVGIGTATPQSILDIESTTGDHDRNAVHYRTVNPRIDLDATAAGNHQSSVRFQKNGTVRWSLLNDVNGDDSQNIGFKNWLTGEIPFVVTDNGAGITGPLSIYSPIADLASPMVTISGNYEGALGCKAGIRPNGIQQVGPYGGGISLMRLYNDGTTYRYADVLTTTGSGNVGIGTTNPLTLLDVDGKFKVETRMGSPTRWTIDVGDGTSWRGHFVNSQGANLFTITDYGPVGISNPNPQAKLDIVTDSGYDLRFSGTSGANIYAPEQPLTIGTFSSPLLLTLDHTLFTVDGDLCVTGQKNAVVPTSQGTTKVYCDESTEVWFADRGEGQLVNGRCRVNLDPLYLETVTMDAQYPLRVAEITFYGEHGQYHVERDATGFTVIDAGGGNAPFSWKVEAKRKGYESARLEVVKQATDGRK